MDGSERPEPTPREIELELRLLSVIRVHDDVRRENEQLKEKLRGLKAHNTKMMNEIEGLRLRSEKVDELEAECRTLRALVRALNEK